MKRRHASQPDATFDKTPQRKSIQTMRNKEINTQRFGRVEALKGNAPGNAMRDGGQSGNQR